MTDEDNKDDEVITFKLPRRDAEVVRQMIREREAMNYIKGWFTTWWVWMVAGGVISVWTLWDKVFNKVPV
jgi:hypothetical protein